MRLRRLLFGSLATTLLWQTVLISILPMLAVAMVALYASSALIQARFAADANYVAQTAANRILRMANQTAATADLLAEFPTTRAFAQSGDRDNLTTLLASMRAQLGVDVLEVTDPNGVVLASGEAEIAGRRLPDSLVSRATGESRQAWVLVNEPDGLIVHALAPIRGSGGENVGFVDVGTVLGPALLSSIQSSSNAELVLSSNSRVTAATLGLDGIPLSELRALDSQPSHGLTRSLTVRGTRYLATYTSLPSHTGDSVTLTVLASLAPIERVTHMLWMLLSVLGIALCIIVVLLTWRMASGIIAPFRQLVSAAQKIQQGDLSARVDPKARHEIRVLEVAFNTMIESLGERERERAKHESELLHIASHDPLTGLPNRNLLEQGLNNAVAAAAEGTPSTLLYLDLDQFKIVNDTLGHGSGDRLLVTIAHLVQSVLRSEDMLARLGGDEFAALLPGIDTTVGIRVAERVRRAVGEYRFVEEGRGFALGASIGLTAITGLGSASEVLGQADIACYTAKSEGRNRVAVYEPGAATLAVLSGDGKWTVEVRDALQDGRLRLVFQPVMRLKSGYVDHYETLLRLVDREGNLIGPGSFIPAAERSGLIREIDQWVLNAALDRIQRERAQGNQIRLAVNLSGITLSSSESTQLLRRAIETKGVDPRALIFEITETALMTNLGKVRSTVEALREIGCHFALDDFGAGFSSFTYLAQLPVDSVKIDGSFVRDVAGNPVNQAIVRAIANVTRSVGKQSVAEWVEDAETLAVLRRLHVDLAQGYYIGRPAERLAPAARPVPMKTPPRPPRAQTALAG